MNGFLNLYAWADSLKGHLVPHTDIPVNPIGTKPLYLSIVQNSLATLRGKVAVTVDCHGEQFIDGTWRWTREAAPWIGRGVVSGSKPGQAEAFMEDMVAFFFDAIESMIVI